MRHVLKNGEQKYILQQFLSGLRGNLHNRGTYVKLLLRILQHIIGTIKTLVVRFEQHDKKRSEDFRVRIQIQTF